MPPSRVYVVPEPAVLRFTGRWFSFDGFSNFPEFLTKEFGIPKGSWVVEKSEGPGDAGVEVSQGRVRIWGDERVAYATIIQLLRQGGGKALPEVKVVERFHFKFRGFHLDVARGGVPTVGELKRLLRLLFLLKYTHLALYLEDLFPWESYPDIGVHRGRYSREELREVIEYGSKLGVEVFPSLELCGHMENILVLPPYRRYSEWHRPSEGVLDVGDEEAREFAYKLLREVLEFFPSSYIHVGGDETWALGRGRSLDRTGVFKGPELYEEHHRRLVEMVRERGKTPMVWGDMITAAYLRESERRYWAKLMESPIWRNSVVVYWDYSPRPKEHFLQVLRSLKERGLRIFVAPGLWNWNRYYPDYPTALENLRNLLTAARELGIEGFLVTAWGDDGSECLFSLLDPLILAAMEIAEGSGEWEEKWAVISGEPREVVELRKLFGEVDTVVRDWQTRWGIWIPKHLLLKTDIYKIGRRYLPREKFEELEKSLEKVLEKARGLELPPDLEFVKRFYEAVLKVLRGEVSVSDYLSLARIYAELWLRERKREGLDNVVGRFWRAAGIHDLRLLE